MTTDRDRRSESRSKLCVLVHAIGIRVVVWGGVALLAYLAVGDVSVLVPGGRTARRPESKTGAQRLASSAWPHLRGPQYSGLSEETGLANSWPAEGPPVLWHRHLGEGYSGFTAAGDRVYTQAQDAFGQRVLCLDSDTGETIWHYHYGWPYDHAGRYPGPRATPTYRDGHIYFAGPRGWVGCLRASDGSRRWQLNLIEKFDSRGIDFGYSCSPLVEDGLVILPAGGVGAGLVALDARDGTTVWAVGNEPASFSSAIPVDVAGERYVVALMKNALVLTDLKHGQVFWKDMVSEGYDEHAAFPVYESSLLMVAGPFRAGARAYRVQAVTSGDESPAVDVSEIWSSRLMSNDVASSLVIDGYVYGFDIRDSQSRQYRPSRGHFRCIRLQTGEEAWSTDRTGHVSLIAADGKLIMFSDTGEVLVVRATPEKYEELARTQVFRGETCWTAPSLCRGRLFLRSPTRAACLYVGDPALLNAHARESATLASEIPQTKQPRLTWLLGGRRGCPADHLTAHVLWWWYWLSLLTTVVPAAVLAATVFPIVRWKSPDAARRMAPMVFWIAVFIAGFAAAEILNRNAESFAFTWPASLFVAHQIALIAILWSRQEGRGPRAWWTAVAAGLGFLAFCVAYFHACRILGLSSEWAFLFGFLPSWPVAIPVAYRLRRNRHLVEHILWAAVSFTTYYLACAAFLAWTNG